MAVSAINERTQKAKEASIEPREETVKFLFEFYLKLQLKNQKKFPYILSTFVKFLPKVQVINSDLSLDLVVYQT